VKLIDYGVSSHTDGTMVGLPWSYFKITATEGIIKRADIKNMMFLIFVGTEKYFRWHTVLDGMDKAAYTFIIN